MIRVGSFGITADTHGYTVGRITIYKNKKTGEESEVLTANRYFTDMEGCLRYIRKQMQYEEVSKAEGGIETALSALKAANEHFGEMIASIKKEEEK